MSERLTRVEIDPNSQRRGLVRARLQDFDGPAELGDTVVVFESEDSLHWRAEVVEIDGDYASLEVDDRTRQADEDAP